MSPSNRHNTPPCNALHPAGDGESIEPEKPYYVKREAIPCVRNPRIDWQEASNLHVLAIPGYSSTKHYQHPFIRLRERPRSPPTVYISIVAYPLDSLDSRPRWNKALITGVTEPSFLIVRMPGVTSPERANRLMNSTLNGWRLRKTWVLWSGSMFLNLDRGDVTNGGLIRLWMLVLRTCRRAT